MTHRLEIFTPPTLSPGLEIATPLSQPDPVQPIDATVERLDDGTVQVTKLPQSFNLSVVSPNGRFYTTIELSGAQQTQLKRQADELIARLTNEGKLEAGAVISHIDLTHLYLFFEGKSEPFPLSGAMQEIFQMRSLYDSAVDPRNKFPRRWAQRPPGVRAAIYPEYNHPAAFVRSPAQNQQIHFTDANFADAFAQGINAQQPRPQASQLKALKERQAARRLKAGISQLLTHLRGPNDEAVKTWNDIWDFAVEFEIAYPILPTPDPKAPLLPCVQKKLQKAKELVGENNLELAKDLARSGIVSPHAYQSISAAIGSPMKTDSLEEALTQMAKAVVNGDPALALQSPALKNFLASFGDDKPAIENYILNILIPKIQQELRDPALNALANPDPGVLIQSFNQRTHVQELLALTAAGQQRVEAAQAIINRAQKPLTQSQHQALEELPAIANQLMGHEWTLHGTPLPNLDQAEQQIQALLDKIATYSNLPENSRT